MRTRAVDVPAGPAAVLSGDLAVPDGAPLRGVVLFAHGSGSSRHSPRNRAVAARLHEAGLATLLVDLLTAEEERAERATRHLRFDIPLLADRLDAALTTLAGAPEVAGRPVGLFGASTGAAAALALAGRRSGDVAAVVSRGGRPDLTPDGLLAAVRAPTLLIVGERDPQVLTANRRAQAALVAAETELTIVPGASHLFEEPGALEQVAGLAAAWLTRHLGA